MRDKMNRMNKRVSISARLTALAQMVTPGNRVCDVGCDHGLLAVYLVQRHISPYVIAMDVRKGPLGNAAKHVLLYDLSAYIETRLSDGLNSLRAGEAQTILCAGMGGRLMMRILRDGSQVIQSADELILQPQSEIPQFRRFLREEGYCIFRENMIEENGKYYFLMKVRRTGEPDLLPEPMIDSFGPCLLSERSPVLYRYLRERETKTRTLIRTLTEVSTERGGERLHLLTQELSLIRQALSFYDEGERMVSL
jgi:tRNA (adenine22-N1)-methyltransferase